MAANETIFLFRPYMGQEEIDAVSDVLRSGWIGLGPITAEFEKRFSEYIGVKHSVGLNSCTAALDIALRLLRINHGDEVLVPAMTFVSTGHVVAYNLAYPIFVDIDENTLQLDIDDMERKITCRTKAVIPVHYGGRPCDMDRIREIAHKHNLVVIEDAAHACGAEYKTKKAGSIGDIGCFSFHAVKNLATADGGMITLNEESLARRAKKLRWLGIDKGTWDRSKLDKSYWWEYFVDEIGLKDHMNDLNASIGLVQLKKLDAMNAKRKQIAGTYTEAFKGLPIITPPQDDKDYKSSWHIYYIKIKNRDKLSVSLNDSGIQSGVHYKPINTYSCYGNRAVCPKAEKAFESIISLPCHPGLTDEQVNRVIDHVVKFAKQL